MEVELEAQTRTQQSLMKEDCNMSEKEKRSEDKLSFLKNKKNALLNKFLTSKFRTELGIYDKD